MVVRALVIVLAVVAYVVTIPAGWVERSYSQGVYASMQPIITSLSNRVPFALLDVLGLVLLVLLVASLVRAIEDTVRLRSWKPGGKSVLNFVAVAAILYLIFEALWGLNYQRQPMGERLSFDPDLARPEAVSRLAAEAVHQLNDAYEPSHRSSFPEWVELPVAMRDPFLDMQSRLTPGAVATAGVPKRSLLTFYFERAGVSGMTDPFFLEVLVDRSLLPFERPFVVAHEWAHLAGYANEGEANFVGWLVCVNGRPFAAYSGWLYLYTQAMAAVPPAQRAAIVKALKPGPRADLEALAERARRIEPRLQSLSWKVYDRYLKANRVDQGVASYEGALQLILGTRFVNGWLPVLRPAPEQLQTPPGR